MTDKTDLSRFQTIAAQEIAALDLGGRPRPSPARNGSQARFSRRPSAGATCMLRVKPDGFCWRSKGNTSSAA